MDSIDRQNPNMPNDIFAFIYQLCLLAGVILIIAALVQFKEYFDSLNCFFFASVAFLIPLIIVIIESFPTRLIIYGVILILILFYARYARVNPFLRITISAAKTYPNPGPRRIHNITEKHLCTYRHR